MTGRVCPECRGKVWDKVDVWEIPCPACGGEGEIAVADATRLGQKPGTTTEPRCERCGRQLTILPDFSGEGRAAVVCFDCEPPLTLCGACAGEHPSHGDGGGATP